MSITKFLSNKWNIYGLWAGSYLFMGYMFNRLDMTTSQILLAYFIMYISSFAAYLYGMSKGVMITTIKRPNFIKELDKLNEMIKKESDKGMVTPYRKKRKTKKKTSK
tara:strand:- start:1610 stop:1930 length:321 start_codon:yes stop_codon:yes gene_type:complete